MIFASSLDPDQDRQNVGSDLDPNHLTPIYSVPERNVNSKKKSATDLGILCCVVFLYKI